jgi:hypothetical protein
MRIYTALLGTALAIFPAFAQQQQQEKRRVAVLDFGYGAVMSSVQALFGTTQDVGRGISDLIIDRLINDGSTVLSSAVISISFCKNKTFQTATEPIMQRRPRSDACSA